MITAVAALAELPDDVPTRIRFGAGARHEAGRVAAAYGRRVVVVAGRSALATPIGRDVLSALAAAGVEVVDRLTVIGEPDDVGVRGLVERLAAAAPDAIVAIGGGSPLDLAKAASIRPTPARLAALLGGERTELPGLPVIALPTTAGSGAETSFAAIVFDRAAGRKRGVRGMGVAPRDALIDPELLIGAPATVVATAGFDAIAHAVETSASRAADAAAIARGAVALRALLGAIPALVERPRDPSGPWAEAAAAATLMGVNLARSTTCLPHRLQYPVGALTGTAHGAGVAALFPAWLERTAAVAPAPLAALARAAELTAPASDDATAAHTLAATVIDHLERTAMRRTLRDLGVSTDDVDDLVAAVEGSVANDPGPSGQDDLRALYVASL